MPRFVIGVLTLHPYSTSAVSADLDDSSGTRAGLVAWGPVRRTAGPPLLSSSVRCGARERRVAPARAAG